VGGSGLGALYKFTPMITSGGLKWQYIVNCHIF